MFLDTTCVKANIHFPVDWVLLRDGVKSLMQSVELIQTDPLTRAQITHVRAASIDHQNQPLVDGNDPHQAISYLDQRAGPAIDSSAILDFGEPVTLKASAKRPDGRRLNDRCPRPPQSERGSRCGHDTGTLPPTYPCLARIALARDSRAAASCGRSCFNRAAECSIVMLRRE